MSRVSNFFLSPNEFNREAGCQPKIPNASPCIRNNTAFIFRQKCTLGTRKAPLLARLRQMIGLPQIPERVSTTHFRAFNQILRGV